MTRLPYPKRNSLFFDRLAQEDIDGSRHVHAQFRKKFLRLFLKLGIDFDVGTLAGHDDFLTVTDSINPKCARCQYIGRINL